jgi:hypothetical protein
MYGVNKKSADFGSLFYQCVCPCVILAEALSSSSLQPTSPTPIQATLLLPISVNVQIVLNLAW